MPRFTSHVALAIAFVLGLGVAAPAASVVVTNQGAFDAALASGSYLETFNSFPFPASQLGQSQDFSGSGFGFTASSPSGLFTAGDSSADVWLTNATNAQAITFTFTGGTPTAVGGFFFTTDSSGNSVVNSAVTLTIAINDGTAYQVPTGATPTSNFVGFLSDAPITSLTVTVDQGGLSRWGTINDLQVGIQQTHSVPEPTSMISAATAVVFALGAVGRRIRTHITA